MARLRLVVVGSLCLWGCREPNPAFMPDAMPTTGDAGTSSSTSVTTSATASSESGTTLPGTTTSTTESSSSGTSDPSTGTTDPIPYAQCNDAPCPRGWDECIAIDEGSWCSHPCDQPEDCEVPATGNAEVVCAGPSGQECALDCSDGQQCPDGMTCVDVFANIVRCVWEP